MATFLITACIKQRRVLSGIIRIDQCAILRTNACTDVCIQCRCYHATPIYLKKRKTSEERKQRIILSFKPKVKVQPPVVDIWRNMTVTDLAKAANRPINDVLEAISYTDPEKYNKHTPIDDRNILYETIRKLGAKFRVIPNPMSVMEEEEEHDVVKRPPPDPSVLIKRHPVVTVMGHVDHGKTTLLDSLRNTSVVASEFGGITQHIGAFNVTLPSGETITFLDTPGHAAFTSMRERGANATDIIVLVVAADDGVMDQTIESIRMAKDAKVPIIVAINKIDKPGADIKRTQSMLSQHGIQVEALGGDVQSVNISALQGTNLTELVETIATQAELMSLKGDPKGLVEGVVIEASVHPGRGKLATILVQRGTLRKGAILVSGLAWAKVRAMFDHAGQPLTKATLSEAAQIIGWRELPDAGNELLEVESEHKANIVIRFRQDKNFQIKQLEQMDIIEQKQSEYRAEYQERLQRKRTLGRFRAKRKGLRQKEMAPDDGVPKLNVVVKADVVGSAEAILDVFDTYDDDNRCQFNVVHYGVGSPSETDITLAQAFNAIVYCFNVPIPPAIKKLAADDQVPIRTHKVIYKLVDDVKEEISKKLPPGTAEEVLGKANVLQLFVVTEGKKKWNVAGCRCIDGRLKKSAMFRLLRENEIIYEGKLASMRHLKNEVDSIKNNVECGLRFEDPNVSLEAGDTLVCYRIYETEPKTHWDPGF